MPTLPPFAILDPRRKKAQAGIREWYDLLNTMENTLPKSSGLGQMYVDDERFTRNIDKFGDGLFRVHVSCHGLLRRIGFKGN
jgi:hypothetical protein